MTEAITLSSAKTNIKKGLDIVRQNFVIIGFYLKYIRDNELYKEDGCRDINEFAEKEFGLSKYSTSRYMSINDKFSVNGNSPELLENYKGFGVSQLTEMINMTEEQMSQVTENTTIKEIRNIKSPIDTVATSQQENAGKKPEQELSALGKPKRIYPEGSLLSTHGCEGGSCFSCARDCQIRDGDRYCVEAPMGNPFYCDTMYIDEDLHGKSCMFINLDLAYCRAGDHEPVPCCKECKNQCEYICKRAENARKLVQTEPVKYFDKLAAYWCKREITVELYELAKSKDDEDIDVFNQYFEEKYINEKEIYAPAHNIPGYEISFRTDKEGVHFDDKEKTVHSWPLLIGLVCQEAENETPASNPGNYHENADGLKRLKDIRKEIRVKSTKGEVMDNKPTIVSDMEESVVTGYEEEVDETYNFSGIPRATDRHVTMLAKLFVNKKEQQLKYGRSSLQIPTDEEIAGMLKTYGLIEKIYIDGNVEVSACEEIIEFSRDNDDLGICLYPKFANHVRKQLAERDSAKHHLKEAIEREEMQIAQLGETWKLKQPDTFLKHQTILIALKCHLTDMEFPNPDLKIIHKYQVDPYKEKDIFEMVPHEINTAWSFFDKKDYASADFYLFNARKDLWENEKYEFDRHEPFKPKFHEGKVKQPEMPILKNNDQRKEWVENYKTWGEWYYDEHIDCYYYKYDFPTGDRLVVEEYRDRERYWADDKKDEQFYHLLLNKKQAYGGKRTYEEKFSHQTSSMTEIVDYLKELQKKR